MHITPSGDPPAGAARRASRRCRAASGTDSLNSRVRGSACASAAATTRSCPIALKYAGTSRAYIRSPDECCPVVRWYRSSHRIVEPLSSNRQMLTRATSSVRAHVSRMSRSRSLTVTETPVCREVSSVSAWLCAASRRSLSRSSCCDVSATSRSRLTAPLSSARSPPALALLEPGRPVVRVEDLERPRADLVHAPDEPQAKDARDEQRHAEDEAADEQDLFEERRRPSAVQRPLDQVESHEARVSTMSVMMMAMRVFSMRGTERRGGSRTGHSDSLSTAATATAPSAPSASR